MKTCSACKLTKNLADFNKNKNYCRICSNAYSKQHRINNRKQINERHYKRICEFRQMVNDLKSKYGCQVCGETEQVCLDFHHLRDKIDAISNIIYTKSPTKIVNELNKCVVLCRNCHAKIHAELVSLPKNAKQCFVDYQNKNFIILS